MEFKKIGPFWWLADPLTVQQAAALIAGFDPNTVRFNSVGGAWFESETGLTDTSGIGDVLAAFSALTNAIDGGRLKAQLRYDAEPRYVAGIDNLIERSRWQSEDVQEIEDGRGESYVIAAAPNWSKSLVARTDLIGWLQGTPIRPEVFFPAATEAPDYLDPNHPRYAPKLAAAVRVWQAMDDANLLRGKTPAAAMKKWLEDRHIELGLIWGGEKNGEGIGEVAKVANWKTGGGPPPTPGD